MKIYRSKRAFWARYKTPENYWHTTTIGAEEIIFFLNEKNSCVEKSFIGWMISKMIVFLSV
jgi:hypothetical protein